MAEETPFASSFGNYGDPRRYMNKGEMPGKKVEQFVAKIKKSPLANLAGIFLAGEGEESTPSATPAPALGQGISAPVVPPVGVNPTASGGVGIRPGSFQMSTPTLPQIGTGMPAQNVDIDGDGLVDTFWGINK